MLTVRTLVHAYIYIVYGTCTRIYTLCMAHTEPGMACHNTHRMLPSDVTIHILHHQGMGAAVYARLYYSTSTGGADG